MAVCSELSILESRLRSKYPQGGPELGQLYEVVQYCGSVLPRL